MPRDSERSRRGSGEMTKSSCTVQAQFISDRFDTGVRETSAPGRSQRRTVRTNYYMKTKSFAATALAALLLAGCATEHHESQAELQAMAKVTRADAEKTALTKAPNGTVKEGELEKEKGKLIWSFDITTPDSKDITEVGVDAVTGEVVSVEKEKAEGEKQEKEKEKD
jgi:uncharacterized membrane protein YkoI